MKRPPRMPRIKTIATTAKRKPPLKTKPAASSSGIEGHDYDPGTGHLTVTFRGGRRYRYECVDQETADRFGRAESQGRFLHANIAGKFDASKI
jgi:hypothetical protein